MFDFLLVTIGVCDALFSLVFQASGDVVAYGQASSYLTRLCIVRFLKHLYMVAFGFTLADIAIIWVTVSEAKL